MEKVPNVGKVTEVGEANMNFILHHLDRRSYHLVYDSAPLPKWSSASNKFTTHLRISVLLANLEISALVVDNKQQLKAVTDRHLQRHAEKSRDQALELLNGITTTINGPTTTAKSCVSTWQLPSLSEIVSRLQLEISAAENALPELEKEISQKLAQHSTNSPRPSSRLKRQQQHLLDELAGPFAAFQPSMRTQDRERLGSQHALPDNIGIVRGLLSQEEAVDGPAGSEGGGTAVTRQGSRYGDGTASTGVGAGNGSGATIIASTWSKNSNTTTAELLAELAWKLLGTVERADVSLGGAMRLWLKQAAFLTGHIELLDKLLPPTSPTALSLGSSLTTTFKSSLTTTSCSASSSITITSTTTPSAARELITTFCRAWEGYSLHGPLPRRGRQSPPQTCDWLDFSPSCARAVLIAHRVLEQLLMKPEPDQQSGSTSNKQQWMVGAEDTWVILQRLFKRPRACRPLALAMLLLSEEHSLHDLAIQAAHMAVHSRSQHTVSLVLDRIRRGPWLGADASGLSPRLSGPVVDLSLLIDLVENFPTQAVELLESLPLTEVKLEDNVVPFVLRPGFRAVAVSPLGADDFQPTKAAVSGRRGSTKDADYLSTQHEDDLTIEASLLFRQRTWFAFALLFGLKDWRRPTTRAIRRVLGRVVIAACCQGPGGISMAVLMVLLFFIIQFTVIMVVVVPSLLIMLLLGLPYERLRMLGQWLLGCWRGWQQVHPICNSAAQGDGLIRVEHEDGQRSMGIFDKLWKLYYMLVNAAVGWDKGCTVISCYQVPLVIDYARRHHTTISAAHRALHHRGQQLDTLLLETLLRAPGVPSSVFGSKSLRALILFKWQYFTAQYIYLQLLLHLAFMVAFLVYAFSIKNQVPTDAALLDDRAVQVLTEGDLWLGSRTPDRIITLPNPDGCRLDPPSRTQFCLLVALGLLTVDTIVCGLHQVVVWARLPFHYTLAAYSRLGVFLSELFNSWSLLGACRVGLMAAIMVLHVVCWPTQAATQVVLRRLAAGQIVVLFLLLLRYATAFETPGSFVRMVLTTIYNMSMFFAFLVIVSLGFALAIMVAQGSDADAEETSLRLFTLLYGSVDVSDLSSGHASDDPEAPTRDPLARVLLALYMVLASIILLNLLIAIISESYERVRENERWESLRNKASLIVNTENHMFCGLVNMIYRGLSSPPTQSKKDDNGCRYLYVITPEKATAKTHPHPDPKDGDEQEDDVDIADSGGWSRLGAMKKMLVTERHRIAAAAAVAAAAASVGPLRVAELAGAAAVSAIATAQRPSSTAEDASPLSASAMPHSAVRPTTGAALEPRLEPVVPPGHPSQALSAPLPVPAVGCPSSPCTQNPTDTVPPHPAPDDLMMTVPSTERKTVRSPAPAELAAMASPGIALRAAPVHASEDSSSAGPSSEGSEGGAMQPPVALLSTSSPRTKFGNRKQLRSLCHLPIDRSTEPALAASAMVPIVGALSEVSGALAGEHSSLPHPLGGLLAAARRCPSVAPTGHRLSQ